MAQRLALLIGNSRYDSKRLPDLITATEDVNDLSRVLLDPLIGGFTETINLIDKTDLAIKREIERFYSNKKPADLLLLYYSGHGMLDRSEQLHLATKNSDPKHPRVAGISARDINDWMQESRAKKLVLVLDCCYSGAFARTQLAKNAVGHVVAPETVFVDSGTGCAVITATTATGLAWEGEQLVGEINNSLFTHYLVEGLETGSADQDKDGTVTLDEWYDYAYEQVIDNTTVDMPQVPRKWISRQQGNPILIAKNVQPKSAPLPLFIVEHLNSQNMVHRLHAIVELARLHEMKKDSVSQTAADTLQRLIMDEEENSLVRGAALGGFKPELLTSLIEMLLNLPSFVPLDTVQVVAKGNGEKSADFDSPDAIELTDLLQQLQTLRRMLRDG